jgi:hypothetical protein
LLKRALKKLGLGYKELKSGLDVYTGLGTIQIRNSKAILPSQLQDTLNAIKRGYSMEVIEEGAAAYNWTISEEDDQIVLRRYDFSG